MFYDKQIQAEHKAFCIEFHRKWEDWCGTKIDDECLGTPPHLGVNQFSEVELTWLVETRKLYKRELAKATRQSSRQHEAD